jgi:hypothetical protein
MLSSGRTTVFTSQHYRSFSYSNNPVGERQVQSYIRPDHLAERTLRVGASPPFREQLGGTRYVQPACSHSNN